MNTKFGHTQNLLMHSERFYNPSRRLISRFVPGLIGIWLACLMVLLSVFGPQSVSAQPGTQPPDPPPHPEPTAAPVDLTLVGRTGPVQGESVSANFLGSGDSQIHGLVYDNGYLWASTRTSPARILKIDPSTLTVDSRIILNSGQNEGEDIVAANGYLWVILYTEPAELVRVDPATVTAQTAIGFSTSELIYGTSLHYAFGYLWVGSLNRMAQVDISDPLHPTYTIYDYASVATNGYILFHAITSSSNYLWASVKQYSSTTKQFTDNTFMRIDPSNPGSGYLTNTVPNLFPDDMVYTGNHLYHSSEDDPPATSPSTLYEFNNSLSAYTTTLAYSSGSYGTFLNPLDQDNLWATYIASPGTIKKFNLDLSPALTVTLPSGYNDPSEIVFDPNGNMYISTWQDPSGIVRYSAPSAVSDLTISKSSSDAVLSWTHAESAVIAYEVWRSTDPYFTPGVGPASKLADLTAPGSVTATVVYTDTGAIGDTSTNYYYEVQAVNAEGLLSPLSNRVGEFDFPLTPGTVGNDKYSVIGFPLDATSQIPDADSLATYIGPSVLQVLHWDTATQTYEFWLPSIGFGTNFSLNIGEVYWLLLNSTSPSVVSLTGDVPAAGSIQFSFDGSSPTCLYNDFSMPLDQAHLTNASQVASDIGNVDQILHWDAATQTYEFWLPGIGFGTNFSTEIGYPYHVCMSAATTWP